MSDSLCTFVRYMYKMHLYRSLLNVLFVLLLKLPVYAQLKPANIHPLVNVPFSYSFYSETFDSSAREWPVISSNENLFIMQEGEYILHRKSKISPFAIIGEFNEPFSSFKFVTSLKLIKSASEDGSIGCIFMAQPGGKGGFIFEINQREEYRLRQITSSGYEYLTGNPKEGGWSKSSLLKPVNMANLFEVRTFDRKYDLYLNGKLLLNFIENAYASGNLGFIIGPGTIGKVDFVYLFSNEKKELSTDIINESDPDKKAETDIVELAESLIQLKLQLNKMEKENGELKERLESFRGIEIEQHKMKANYEGRIAALDKKMKQQDKSFDSLLLINAELLRYKEMVKGNESGDVVISLSKNLKAEKLKADEFARQNQALKDSIRVLNAIIKKEPAGTMKKEDSNTPVKPVKEEEKIFVLPKEN